MLKCGCKISLVVKQINLLLKNLCSFITDLKLYKSIDICDLKLFTQLQPLSKLIIVEALADIYDLLSDALTRCFLS